MAMISIDTSLQSVEKGLDKPSVTQNPQDPLSAILKAFDGIGRLYKQLTYYPGFACKLGSHFKKTKNIVRPPKKLFKKLSQFFGATDFVYEVRNFNPSKLELNLKSYKEVLSLFKKTIKFTTMVADKCDIKEPKNFKKLNLALSAALSILGLMITMGKNSGKFGISKGFYKLVKAMLDVYLYISNPKLGRPIEVALIGMDFTMDHLS
jgi:hypothetical protein